MVRLVSARGRAFTSHSNDRDRTVAVIACAMLSCHQIYSAEQITL